MYRYSSRSLLRSAAQATVRNAQQPARRYLSTAPPHEKARSWKSSALRWGVAVAGVYYYNTSPYFADSTKRIMKFESESPVEEIESALPTVEAYAASRKQQQQQEQVIAAPVPEASDAVPTDDPAALEEEASSQGAFDPVTGKINWDCPCLGGMAHGPCGEEFRAAFSCFVYSEQEPKGLDCIDKFKGMQDCFRLHPDVYAAELEDDEAELDAELAKEREALHKDIGTGSEEPSEKRLLDDTTPVSKSATPSSPVETAPKAQEDHLETPSKEYLKAETAVERSKLAEESTKESVAKFDQDNELVPKAWHDSRDANEKTEEK